MILFNSLDNHNLAFAVKSDPSKRGGHVSVSGQEIADVEEECVYCWKKMTKRNLTRHILTVHENVKTFSCPECQMMFGAKQTMERHFNKICRWSLNAGRLYIKFR